MSQSTRIQRNMRLRPEVDQAVEAYRKVHAERGLSYVAAVSELIMKGRTTDERERKILKAAS